MDVQRWRRISGDGIVDDGRCSDLPEGIVWHGQAKRGSAKGMKWTCCRMMLGADNRLEKSTPTCVVGPGCGVESWGGLSLRSASEIRFGEDSVKKQNVGRKAARLWGVCGVVSALPRARCREECLQARRARRRRCGDWADDDSTARNKN